MYWHGGPRGLRRGDYILPPSKTGTRNTLASYGTVASGLARLDRVYVTNERIAAVMYASGLPGLGCVYEVEPVGDLTPDPDCNKPGLSWECERALIVGVYPVSKKTVRKVITALARGAA